MLELQVGSVPPRSRAPTLAVVMAFTISLQDLLMKDVCHLNWAKKKKKEKKGF